MRWKAKKSKPSPREGDKRTVNKFLFFPKCIDGEWRWLEFAEIHQVLRYLSSLNPEGPHGLVLTWCDVSWSDGRVRPNGPKPPASK